MKNTIERKTINECRICGFSVLKKVIHFEKMPFTDEFVTQEKIGTEFLGDIDIAVCNSCGCAQNINDTDMGDYYFDYTYSVQASGFAQKFMQELAFRIKQNYFASRKNAVILEISRGTGEQ